MSEFEKAFFKAQQLFKPVEKKGVNTFFKSTAHPNGAPYALYEDQIEATKDGFKAAGISYRHTSRWDDKIYFVGTVFTHQESGLSGAPFEMPLMLDGNVQKTAAAITYARRITYAGAAGLAAETDDDGNAASAGSQGAEKTSSNSRENQLRAKAVFPKGGGLTEGQEKLVYALSKKAGWTMNEVGEYVSLKHGLQDWRQMGRAALDDLLNVFKTGGAARGHIDGLLVGEVPTPNDNDIPF